jgi:hypothetical protein
MAAPVNQGGRYPTPGSPVESTFVPVLTTSTGTLTLGYAAGQSFGKIITLGNMVSIMAVAVVTAINSPNGGMFMRGLPVGINPINNDLVYPVYVRMFGLLGGASGAPTGLVLRDPAGAIIQLQNYSGGTLTNYADQMIIGSRIALSATWSISGL